MLAYPFFMCPGHGPMWQDAASLRQCFRLLLLDRVLAFTRPLDELARVVIVGSSLLLVGALVLGLKDWLVAEAKREGFDQIFVAPEKANSAPLRYTTRARAFVDGAVTLPGESDQFVTAGLVVTSRLRRRARWVRALEEMLGGRRGVVARFIRGRWFPDLPAIGRNTYPAYLRASIPDGVRVLGGGLIEVDERAKRGSGIYLVVDDGKRVEVVFPALLAKLRQYALYRERDVLLLGALRSRAGEWCRAVGLPDHYADLAVASATSYAMIPSTHELQAKARVEQACGTSPLLPSF